MGFFKPFGGIVSNVFAVAANKSGVATMQEVEGAARKAGHPTRGCASLEEALRLACTHKKGEPPRILIGGSLYLAGEILETHA